MLREYFADVLGIALIASFALALVHPRLGGITRFGAGILVISVVLLPIVNIFGDLNIKNTLDDIFDGVGYDGSDSAIEIAFEDGVAEYISDKYRVDRQFVRVNADGFDISTLTAERIYVTLSGRALLLDYKRIESEVAEEFTVGGECEVLFELE